jgi:HlyD family secretion protein
MPDPSGPPSPKPGAPRPRRRFLLAVALVVPAAGGFCWWMLHGQPTRADASPAATAQGPMALKVEVVRPTQGGLRRVTIQPGSVHAFESVDLFAKVSGFLRTQAVDIGDAVKKGQRLAEIDAPELDKEVDEADAAVARARAAAELAAARVATAEAEQAAAAAEVPRAEAALDRSIAQRSFSQKQLERVQELREKNAVDRRLVDEHRRDLDAALAGEKTGRAAILAAKAQANAATAKVQQAKAELAESRAAIRVAEARLDRARVMAGYARIVAPFDGVVTRRRYFPGDFIRSAAEGSQVPLLTVQRTDKMRVVVQVPDRDVPLLDVGDPATLVVDALKGQTFSGAVSRLARAEDPATRTMRIEIDLLNPSGRLCEGMYGRATIELQPPSPLLTLPVACVVGHAPGSAASIFVVRDGRARRTTVTLGDDDGALVEVASGLLPGDSVVVRPGGAVDDGAPVETPSPAQ